MRCGGWSSELVGLCRLLAIKATNGFWLALDVETHEIVGVHIGDRFRTRSQKTLGLTLEVSTVCAVAYTDFLDGLRSAHFPA
jgi:hypothetical protein